MRSFSSLISLPPAGCFQWLVWGLLLAISPLPAFCEAPPAREQAAPAATEPLFQKLEAVTCALVSGAEPTLENARATAFFIHEEGWLFTAGHAVIDAEARPLPNLWVLRNVEGTGSRYFRVEVAHLFGYGDTGRDLALLRIAEGQPDPVHPFPALEWGETAQAGDAILFAGFPLVFDQVYRWPLLRRGWVATTRYDYRQAEVLVLDAISAGGFSGAPVVDERGRLLAVLKGKATGNPDAGFCLATIVRKSDLEKAMQGGKGEPSP